MKKRTLWAMVRGEYIIDWTISRTRQDAIDKWNAVYGERMNPDTNRPYRFPNDDTEDNLRPARVSVEVIKSPADTD